METWLREQAIDYGRMELHVAKNTASNALDLQTMRNMHAGAVKPLLLKSLTYCGRCNGTINLSRDAFSQIADPNAGIVKIKYNQA
ncbi:hypothetical protein F0562_030464 [Nyssa sinensis]|uniref:Uncharacterized protein n=1 Tax=Nyssa sinensis TaxID=561372 RepID=A0A5J5B2U5_9ASTE|nr:hypothetical protein F0562_030464 [Nyssa sinensis]